MFLYFGGGGGMPTAPFFSFLFRYFTFTLPLLSLRAFVASLLSDHRCVRMSVYALYG